MGQQGSLKEYGRNTFNKSLRALVAKLVLCGVSFGSQLCVNVVDDATMPLGSAHVKIVNLADGSEHTLDTKASGSVCFPNIPEGRYSGEARLAGFLEVKYWPIAVSASRARFLTIRLPLALSNVDSVASDVTLSGTLLQDSKPAAIVGICLISSKNKDVCSTTNKLGEYSITLSPGVYTVRIHAADGTAIYKVDLSSPGAVYHDKLTFTR